MRRRQKAGFLSPRSSKIIVTKEKESRTRKSEEKEEKEKEKKKAMVALLVFIMATLEIVLAEKICWTQKVHFGGNVIKNPAR